VSLVKSGGAERIAAGSTEVRPSRNEWRPSRGALTGLLQDVVAIRLSAVGSRGMARRRAAAPDGFSSARGNSGAFSVTKRCSLTDWPRLDSSSASRRRFGCCVCSLGSNAIGLHRMRETTAAPRPALAFHRHRVYGAAAVSVFGPVRVWRYCRLISFSSAPECSGGAGQCCDVRSIGPGSHVAVRRRHRSLVYSKSPRNHP